MHPVYIYAPNSTPAQLLTNGLGRLGAVSCPVSEVVNGAYTVSLEVMPEGVNADKVVKYAIIKCFCPKEGGNKYQYFRLNKITPVDLESNTITASGWHISYDLASDIILNRAWDAKNGNEAISGILTAGISETRFTGSSDIAATTNMHVVRDSILSAILGTDKDNCFLNRWGGEMLRDNFVFNVNSSIGTDNGVHIRYAKNLTGLAIEEDASEVATRIIPSCLSADDVPILLPEVYIDSSRMSEYPLPRVRTVHFSDIKIGKEVDGAIPYPDTTRAFQEMRNRVGAMYAAGADLPKLKIEVNFVDLAQTEEFKDFAELESVNLGDVVHVNYKGAEFSERVVSYEWDALAEMYNNITLGAVAPNIGESLYAADVDLSALKTSMNTTLKQTDKYYGCGINHADGFICTATDGHYAKFNADMMGFFDALGNQVGGMAYINSVLASIASMLTNDATDPECWATIGEVTLDSGLCRGLFLYRKSVSETVPAARLLINTAGSVLLLDKDGKLRFSFETNGITRLYDSNGVARFYSDHSDTRLLDSNGVTRFCSDPSSTRLLDPNGKAIFDSNFSQTIIRRSGSLDNAIFLSDSAAYLILNGVQHPISYT